MQKAGMICLFLLVMTGMYAQQLRIAGVVKDMNTKSNLENVAVRLMEEDSTFIEGCVTDRAGKFELKKGKKGNLLLLFSCMGYEPNGVRLVNIQKETNIGEVLLDELSEKLEEVVVTAERTIRKANRQIIFPSTLQQEASFSAFELLGKMMIPNLQVNATQNTVSSLHSGSVQLRINGIESSLQDVLAILSTQVIKVEYIDMPGARFGDGVACVVNFITRRASEGFSGGTNMKNAVTTGYGNDNFYLKYNNKLSEFALNYDLSYRDFDDQHVDVMQDLLLKDGSTRSLEKKGIESPYKVQSHNLSLTYNLTQTEKSVFNVKLSNSWQNNPYYNTIQSIRETGKADLNAYTGIKDKTIKPVLDIYYQLNLPAEQTIMANVVGTYISSDYTRNYAEYLTDKTLFGNEYNYVVDGDKYSVIAELIYTKYINQNTLWTNGIKYNQSYLENGYNGSTGDVSTTMDNSDLYFFTELEGSIQNLGYTVGVGFSRQYFNENTHKYNYYSIRPKVSLSYGITNNLFIRYAFSINPMLPELARISDVDQWQNEYEVVVGNPGLKPYRAYRNNLSLTYVVGPCTVYLMGYYQHNPKPMMMDIVKRLDMDDSYYFQYSYANQKSYDHLQGQLYLQYKAIENVLDFSAYGGINRYINKGNEYTHTYTGYFGGITMNAMYKKIALSASLRSGITGLSGETKRHSQAGADIALTYRLKRNLRLGVGLLNPFFGDGEKSGEELISEVVNKETWNYTKDLGNMLYFSFSWNFSIGKKHNAGRTKLHNSDYDSGVVK